MTDNREIAIQNCGSHTYLPPTTFPVNQWQSRGGSGSPWPVESLRAAKALKEWRTLVKPMTKAVMALGTMLSVARRQRGQGDTGLGPKVSGPPRHATLAHASLGLVDHGE